MLNWPYDWKIFKSKHISKEESLSYLVFCDVKTQLILNAIVLDIKFTLMLNDKLISSTKFANMSVHIRMGI